MESSTTRNHTLDVIKLIASFLVVFIHVPFYGIVGEYIALLSRVAVPLFFMTSGFFCYNNDSKTILRKIKKIFFILIFTSVLYNLTNALFTFYTDGKAAVLDYFLKFLEWKKWLRLLIFNYAFSATRLWFLLALIYVYFLQIALNKCKFSSKTILVFSILGIVLHLTIGTLLPLLGCSTPDYLCRNFLLFGYPFFALGLIFREYKAAIEQTPKKILIICLITGIVLSGIPLFYHSVSQISVGTLLLVFAAFAFALTKASVAYPAWIQELCKCSLGIYVFHRPVTTVTQFILGVFHICSGSVIYGILCPFAVCILTALFTHILMKIQIKLTAHIQNSKTPAY